jgi:hypothetical protein
MRGSLVSTLLFLKLSFSLSRIFRINLIDKSSLHGDTFSYSGDSLVWKARLFLFVGFALIAGGLAGSVVSHVPQWPSFFVAFSLTRSSCTITSVCAHIEIYRTWSPWLRVILWYWSGGTMRIHYAKVRAEARVQFYSIRPWIEILN